MEYTKTPWENGKGPSINQTNLNNIEEAIVDVTSRILVENTTKTVGIGQDFETLAGAWNWAVGVISKYTITLSLDIGTHTLNIADVNSSEVSNIHVVLVGASRDTSIVNCDFELFIHNSSLKFKDLTFNSQVAEGTSEGAVNAHNSSIFSENSLLTCVGTMLFLHTSFLEFEGTLGSEIQSGYLAAIRLQSGASCEVRSPLVLTKIGTHTSTRAIIIYNDCTMGLYATLTINGFASAIDGAGFFKQNWRSLILNNVTQLLRGGDEDCSTILLNSTKLTLNGAILASNGRGYGLYADGVRIVDLDNQEVQEMVDTNYLLSAEFGNSLPITDPLVVGQPWNNLGILTISVG